MAEQKRQRLVMELLDLLVEWRVRAPLEDQQFGITNAALQSVGETRRGELVVTAECDQSGHSDATELRLHVVCDHGIGLPHEVLNRLHRPASDKGGQRLD